MRADADDPVLLNHFTVSIFPFFHALTGDKIGPRLDLLAERWQPWCCRLDDEALAEALEATSFFLPYVRSLVYPETAALREEPAGERYEGWVRRLRRLSGWGAGRLLRELPPAAVLRLTCCGPTLDALAELEIAWPRPGVGRDRGSLAARLDWADALLFPSGLGFLLLRFRLAAERPRLSELIRLNRGLQLVYPPALGWKMPVLRPRQGEAVPLRDLLDDLLRGLATPSTTGGSATETYTATEAGRAYGEHCQLLSYACVGLAEEAQKDLPAGVFPTGVDRVLFEYAASLGLGETIANAVWAPSRRQALRLSRDNELNLWRCWRAMTLKESLVFLATEDLPFTRAVLPGLIERDYLPLYLYTLYQKFQLSVFADGLMREVAQVEGHLRGARALLRRFVAFRNRFWFSEVTRKPQGGDLYRALQQGLEVPALYQMVTASVKEAKEYYEERWDRQVRQVVTLLGLVGGPLAGVAGAARYLSGGLGSAWAAALLLLLLGLAVAAVAIVYLLRRKTTSRAARRKRRQRPRPTVRLWRGPDQGQPPADQVA